LQRYDFRIIVDAHDELKQAIPAQPQLGTDETSLKNNGKTLSPMSRVDLVHYRCIVYVFSHRNHPLTQRA